MSLISKADETSVTSVISQRQLHSNLLTKIYYPDTLYPDSYTFFTDRTVLSFDRHDQQSVTVETNLIAISKDSLPKSVTNKIQSTERQYQFIVCTLLNMSSMLDSSIHRQYQIDQIMPAAIKNIQ
jgi:hypothetical protein